jgi:carboxyl-terminal processing protease
VESLWDKHSSYFNPKDAKEFAEVLRWDFEWIWAVIDEHMKGILVRKVFQDSPAKKAWIQDGDIIVKVGNDSMVWLATEDAVKKIRWPKGSKVKISYLRWKEDIKNVEITRDTIMIPSVQSTVLSGSNIGYIEVVFFWENTSWEFRKELQSLTQSWVSSLVLDFRDNGWWFLDTAVDILSHFFQENTLVVRTRQNDPKLTEELLTHSVDLKIDKNLPIVMLINTLSASATEIVAGALQDYKRAIIVWEKSYGKWSVQEPFLLDDGSILKITVWRWYTPNDQNIDKNGIHPDIQVPIYESDYQAKNDRQLNAAKEIIQLFNTSGSTLDSVIQKAKELNFTE